MNDQASDPAEQPATLLQAQRLGLSRNQELIFGPLDFALHPGEVVLIDDVMTSGATLAAAARACHSAGASRISVLVLARVEKAP